MSTSINSRRQELLEIANVREQCWGCLLVKAVLDEAEGLMQESEMYQRRATEARAAGFTGRAERHCKASLSRATEAGRAIIRLGDFSGSCQADQEEQGQQQPEDCRIITDQNLPRDESIAKTYDVIYGE